MSDYTSVASSSFVSWAELAKELQKHAETLKSPRLSENQVNPKKNLSTSVTKKKHSLGTNVSKMMNPKNKIQLNRSTSHKKFMS